MQLIFANNARSTLAGAITNTALNFTVQAGAGALFPNPNGSQYALATLVDSATGLLNEIVMVTGRSGDTFTIVRAQEGTDALSWLAGDIVSNRWTAGSAAAMRQAASSPTVYGTAGTFTYTIVSPTLFVRLWGGGGGGGAADAGVSTGSGGAGGTYLEVTLFGLAVGETLTVTIGAGGTGGTGTAGGTAGGHTSIASGTQAISTATCPGGPGGPYASSALAAGNAATGTFDFQVNGGYSRYSTSYGTTFAGGAGGDAPLGGGGAPGSVNGGDTGFAPGGGGGGGSYGGGIPNNGGPGAPGGAVLTPMG